MDTKEKLVRVKTRELKNEVHFRFHFENERLYTKYDPQKLGIEMFIGDFRRLLDDEDTALEKIRKSADTARIADADMRFDSSFLSMHQYAKVFLHHFDPDVRSAAENLDVIFTTFGNITKQAYRQELASSYNMMQELRARPDDVALLNLEPWIDEHEKSAKALDALLEDRTDETAHKTDLRTVDVRLEIDAVYQKITDRIDSMINIYGKSFIPEFVAEYNAHATEYKNTLAQHLGRIHKTDSND